MEWREFYLIVIQAGEIQLLQLQGYAWSRHAHVTPRYVIYLRHYVINKYMTSLCSIGMLTPSVE